MDTKTAAQLESVLDSLRDAERDLELLATADDVEAIRRRIAQLRRATMATPVDGTRLVQDAAAIAADAAVAHATSKVRPFA